MGMTELATAADLARRYGVSRQAVHRWWKHRDRLGFPDYVQTGPAGKRWSIEAVDNWRSSYVPGRGGAPARNRNAAKPLVRAS